MNLLLSPFIVDYKNIPEIELGQNDCEIETVENDCILQILRKVIENYGVGAGAVYLTKIRDIYIELDNFKIDKLKKYTSDLNIVFLLPPKIIDFLKYLGSEMLLNKKNEMKIISNHPLIISYIQKFTMELIEINNNLPKYLKKNNENYCNFECSFLQALWTMRKEQCENKIEIEYEKSKSHRCESFKNILDILAINDQNLLIKDKVLKPGPIFGEIPVEKKLCLESKYQNNSDEEENKRFLEELPGIEEDSVDLQVIEKIQPHNIDLNNAFLCKEVHSSGNIKYIINGIEVSEDVFKIVWDRRDQRDTIKRLKELKEKSSKDDSHESTTCNPKNCIVM